MEQSNEIITIEPTAISTVDQEHESLLVMADQAEERVEAVKKIMQASLRLTTEKDWVIIGGIPYLQESGASKVAVAWGVKWEILDVQKEIDEGYPAFTYRMRMMRGNSIIECEGARTGKDEFFTGSGARGPKKSPDQIDALDVKKAAYTNCINNGIKRLIPGLRNIDIANLQAAGMDVGKIKGYTFKTGSKGGSSGAAEVSGLLCSSCGEPITQKVASFSQGKYGAMLCMKCQKKAGEAPPADDIPEDDGFIPPAPPEEY